MSRTIKNIYKRKDGRWEARYPVGKKENGTTKYASLYARTYSEAKDLLQKARANHLDIVKSKKTFSNVLDEWMKMNCLTQKPSTKLKYEYIIEKHIKPELGRYKIHDITELLVNDFLKRKLSNGRLDQSGGLSCSYVKTMCLIIQSAIDYGVKQEYCHKFKTPIVKPPADNKEIVILSVEDQKLLEKKLKLDGSPESTGILISLYMGLRIGEICALRWSDVDFKNKIVHVKHTVSRVKSSDDHSKTSLIIDTPKTKSSLRDIPITSKMYVVLEKAATKSISEYVISSTSTFVSPRTYEYRFHKKLEKYEIQQVNYHALRHTFATRCIEKGIDVKTLSEILGHSNVSITLNTYVHSSMSLKRKQLEKLN